MAQNFLPCDRDQQLLLPPSLREWLPQDHLAWFVLDAVAEMDLGGFYGAYRSDGWGRAAFDPQMMVALLLCAYAVGERSSRAIERRCREDVAFRVIAANQIPDHATIARFRARHENALAETFAQVLALCAAAGLVAVGLVALDGTLVAANASPAATRSYQAIAAEAERMLREAAEADAAEDERLGERRGDELPAELCDPRSRRARLARCTQELERAQAEREAAHQAKLAARAAREQALGRRLAGRKPHPPDPAALAASKINITDPDSRTMRRGEIALQGYNAQLVTCPGQIIVACEVTQAHNDAGLLEPMVDQARAALAGAGLSEPIGTVPADGGNWTTRPSSPCARGARTCSSPPTTGCAPAPARLPRARGRRPTGSRPPSPAQRGGLATGVASSWWSPSSPTSRCSDGRRASCAAACPPAAPSGACSRRLTTC